MGYKEEIKAELEEQGEVFIELDPDMAGQICGVIHNMHDQVIEAVDLGNMLSDQVKQLAENMFTIGAMYQRCMFCNLYPSDVEDLKQLVPIFYPEAKEDDPELEAVYALFVLFDNDMG